VARAVRHGYVGEELVTLMQKDKLTHEEQVSFWLSRWDDPGYSEDVQYTEFMDKRDVSVPALCEADFIAYFELDGRKAVI
jgi:hypothetical protein